MYEIYLVKISFEYVSTIAIHISLINSHLNSYFAMLEIH